jgi:hypothetical protein
MPIWGREKARWLDEDIIALLKRRVSSSLINKTRDSGMKSREFFLSFF